MNFSKDLSLLIKQYRIKKEMSQGDLARKIALNPSAISKIESGKSQPLAETVLKIVLVLNIPLMEIRRLAKKELIK